MKLIKELLKEMNDVPMGDMEDQSSDVVQDEPSTGIHDNLVAFFMSSESPSEDELFAYANEQGLDPEEVKQEVYTLLHDLIQTVGKHNDVPDEDFDPEQLEKGINVELEHTDNPLIAKMLAKDHLSELSDYYDRLQDMEAGAEANDGETDEVDIKMSM